MYWNDAGDILYNQGKLINRNMRCIETMDVLVTELYRMWLIETWDVLKLYFIPAAFIPFSGLIETWDVLKLKKSGKIKECTID